MRALGRRFGRALRRSIAITRSHSARAESSLRSLLLSFTICVQASGWEPGAHAYFRRPVFADPDSHSRHRFRYVRISTSSVCYFSPTISSEWNYHYCLSSRQRHA
jgi:hypothetical protein